MGAGTSRPCRRSESPSIDQPAGANRNDLFVRRVQPRSRRRMALGGRVLPVLERRERIGRTRANTNVAIAECERDGDRVRVREQYLDRSTRGGIGETTHELRRPDAASTPVAGRKMG